MKTTVIENDLVNMERRYRATFLNSLAGFRTAILVGTLSENAVPNVAVFNSLIHFGADPPLWGLVMRPDPLSRDTYRNIQRNNRYTLNYLSVGWEKHVHQTSAKYGHDESEFTACGLSVEMETSDLAPSVGEASICILMDLVQTIPVPLNGTSIVIGKPIRIQYQASLVGPDGFADLASENLLGCIGLDAYCSTRLITRYDYAKRDVLVGEKKTQDGGAG